MTARERVHLVTAVVGHTSGHTIWSAVGENPMLHTHFNAVCVS